MQPFNVAAKDKWWHTHGVVHDHIVRLTYDAIIAAGGLENWPNERFRFHDLENAMLRYNFILKADTIRASWEKATTPWVDHVKDALNGKGAPLKTLSPVETPTPPRLKSTNMTSATSTTSTQQQVDATAAALAEQVQRMDADIQQLKTAYSTLQTDNDDFKSRFNNLSAVLGNAIKRKREEQQSLRDDDGGGSGSSSSSTDASARKRHSK